MPFGAGRLQNVEGQGHAPLAGPADRQLRHHDGQSKNDQKQQIDQDEGRTSVLSCDVGESPYIP